MFVDSPGSSRSNIDTDIWMFILKKEKAVIDEETSRSEMSTFQWCCCSKNLTAGKFLAVIFGLSRVATGYAAYKTYYDFNTEYFPRQTNQIVAAHLIGIEVYCGFYLIFDLLLFIGSRKNIKGLLLSWTILAGISIVSEMSFTLLVIKIMEITIIEMAKILLTIWAIATVIGSMKEIDSQSRDHQDHTRNDTLVELRRNVFVNRYGMSHTNNSEDEQSP